jgi:hypothetical protein
MHGLNAIHYTRVMRQVTMLGVVSGGKTLPIKQQYNLSFRSRSGAQRAPKPNVGRNPFNVPQRSEGDSSPGALGARNDSVPHG